MKKYSQLMAFIVPVDLWQLTVFLYPAWLEVSSYQVFVDVVPFLFGLIRLAVL